MTSIVAGDSVPPPIVEGVSAVVVPGDRAAPGGPWLREMRRAVFDSAQLGGCFGIHSSRLEWLRARGLEGRSAGLPGELGHGPWLPRM